MRTPSAVRGYFALLLVALAFSIGIAPTNGNALARVSGGESEGAVTAAEGQVSRACRQETGRTSAPTTT